MKAPNTNVRFFAPIPNMQRDFSLSMETFGRQSPRLHRNNVKAPFFETSSASLTTLTPATPPSAPTIPPLSPAPRGKWELFTTKFDTAVVAVSVLYRSAKSQVLSLLGCYHPTVDDDLPWPTTPPSAEGSNHDVDFLSLNSSQATLPSVNESSDSAVCLTTRGDTSSQVSGNSTTTVSSLVYRTQVTMSSALDDPELIQGHITHRRTSVARHETVLADECWPRFESLPCSRHTFWKDLDEGRLLPLEAKNAMNVLDVGTRTGDWALDLSESCRNITIIGTDIVAAQPESVPPNVTFYIDDANNASWAWDICFDFIHMRGLNGGIKDWKVTLHAAFCCLRPGGAIEISDMDFDHPVGPLSSDSAWWEWKMMLKALKDATGVDTGIYQDGRRQREVKELGYSCRFHYCRQFYVDHRTHIYNGHSLLASFVEQMKGISERATEFVPSAVGRHLMERLETEILRNGLVVKV
ncbi:hypothetical protein EV126DRAFT_386863 [Verticillium dahliae]|nr:hypothetical protein EV126DRAFT_386863 [Verticillium dahliae]